MMEHDILPLLESAIKKREALKGSTNAIRLVNGFGDGLEGLVLEQYGQHVLAQVFDESWLKRQEMLARFVREELLAEYFIIKDRTQSASSKPDAIRSSVLMDGGSSKTIVEENGIKFEVDLNDTLNTGLFLDMRSNRRHVTERAKGRKVLNTFSYTCSFGVYARAHGAVAVVNVDISRKNLDRGRINYELNHLPSAENEFIRADAVQYLERAVKKDNRFDMIILDPPSFARYEGEIFSVKKDMPRLLEMAIRVLNPEGILFVATNFTEMSHDHLEGMLETAAGDRVIKKVERLGQDVDFVGSGLMLESYLAALLVEL
ncbi:MAG: class I SAM-dependent rRNA methyltransferase [Candidatus Omnitrophica bacterium]|nr:class I SAM-dependent rRNA methyltransferase [Candidatus Omnitrophota bacterium]